MEKYRNTIEFEVYGAYALFSDPVMRVGGEKTSYHIPTYEALKGITESIYWKPSIIWVIDAVRVMNSIQTETKGIRPIAYNGGNELAYYTYLKDVKYQVRAHFEPNNNHPQLKEDSKNENKHHNIAKRMVKRGGRRDIFLGTRECQAFVEPCVFGEGESCYDTMPGEVGYGFMYHGITYAEEAILEEDKDQMTVRFWRPVMKKVIIGSILAGSLFFILGVMIIATIAEEIYSEEIFVKQSQSEPESDESEEVDFSGGIYAGGKFVFPAPTKLSITSKFGMRIHPITGRRKLHGGIDLAAPTGTPMLACADGTVVAAYYHPSWGNHVIISHGSKLYTLYAHASKLLVSKGDKVTAGQQIAKSGSTGNSTGPHYHIEVWNGGYGTAYRTDPYPYLFGK